ncbi:MAG: amidohydrolase family protein, partial [Pseudomonadota bacterium]
EAGILQRGQRPVAWLLDTAELDAGWCLIHCTHMQPEETLALAKTGAIAGLCPITEANLGDGIFDGARFFGAGGRFGVGTDSNVEISLARELRLLEYSQRLQTQDRAVLATSDRSTGRTLWDNAAGAGAAAAARLSGQIAPGMLADLVVPATDHPDFEGRSGDAILDTWIFSGAGAGVEQLWSAGRHIVQDSAHVARAPITAAYRAVMRKLRASL